MQKELLWGPLVLRSPMVTDEYFGALMLDGMKELIKERPRREEGSQKRIFIIF